MAQTGQEHIDILRKHLDGRVDSYEIYLSSDKGLNAEAKDGIIDSLKVKSNSGVGVRIILDRRIGIGSSSVLSEEALKDLVDKAIDGSKACSADVFLKSFSTPEPSPAADGLGIFDPAWHEIAEEKKFGFAVSIEKEAKAADPRIKRVRKAAFSESVRTLRVVNSNGLDLSQSMTYYSGSVSAVAEDNNESQMGWEMDTAHEMKGMNAARIGQGAAKNATRMLGAKKITTLKCPAIIENLVAAELLEALASSFLADNVHKGKSMLAGKKGVKVASERLSIADDGLLKGGWATASFDAEGVPKRKTQLLEKGVCNSFLYDSYWAGRDGVASTGNAVRGGYKGFPGIGVSNLYIEPGESPFEGLLKKINKGLFITELLGVHTINTVSGDFSLGAAGLWIENGEITHPVRGMAIAGNLLGLFSKVEECGADMRFAGSIGSPSLLVSEIEASGHD